MAHICKKCVKQYSQLQCLSSSLNRIDTIFSRGTRLYMWPFLSVFSLSGLEKRSRNLIREVWRCENGPPTPASTFVHFFYSHLQTSRMRLRDFFLIWTNWHTDRQTRSSVESGTPTKNSQPPYRRLPHSLNKPINKTEQLCNKMEASVNLSFSQKERKRCNGKL